MSEREGFASNFVWAVAFVLVVTIIVGGFYYGGFLNGNQKRRIDNEIKTPAVSQKS